MGTRHIAELLLIAGFSVVSPHQAPTAAQGRDAPTVLAEARTALGGEAALTQVTSLAVTGRVRQNRGNVQIPIEFELLCQLPDACVRREEYPAQNIAPSAIGYNGETLLQSALRPGSGRPEVNATYQEFARLLLGAFAGSPTRYLFTFAYGGEAEAPDGRADVLTVSGAGGFAGQLLIHRATHLPVMLLWKVAGGPHIGLGPAAAAPRVTPPAAEGAVGTAAAGRPSPGAAPVALEHRLYYADYRTVQGTRWPFRLRHAIAGTTVEETTIDRVTLNAPIDGRKFEVTR